MLKMILKQVLLALLPLVNLFLVHPAFAQTNCTARTQAAVLNLLRDNQAAGSITPQVIRDMLCSSDVNAVPSIVTAAGSTQGTATAITSDLAIITSGAAGTGVITPATGWTKIWNDTANTLSVYPPSGAQWEALGTNIPVALAPGVAIETSMQSTTQGYVRIYSTIAAQGSGGGGGSSFTIANSTIKDPTGAAFRIWGINVYGCTRASGVIGAIQGGQPFAQNLRTKFPGLSFVRIAYRQDCAQSGLWGNFQPSDLAPFINDLTSHNIVAFIEDHSGAKTVLTGSTSPTLAQEHAWFAALAGFYKTNPYVWFGSMNEPGYAFAPVNFTGSISGTTLTSSNSSLNVGSIITGTGVTTNTYIVSGSSGTYTVSPSQTVGSVSMTAYYGALTQAMDSYRAVRVDGANNAPFVIEAGQNAWDSLDSLLVCSSGWCNNGNPSTVTKNAIASLHNVLWDMHTYDIQFYSSTPNGDSVPKSVTQIMARLNAAEALAEYQLAPSADGIMPVCVCEMSNSWNSDSVLDPNADAEMQAVWLDNAAGYAGASMWLYNATGENPTNHANMVSSQLTVGSLPAGVSLTGYGNNAACYIARTVPLGQTTASSCPTSGP